MIVAHTEKKVNATNTVIRLGGKNEILGAVSSAYVVNTHRKREKHGFCPENALFRAKITKMRKIIQIFLDIY